MTTNGKSCRRANNNHLPRISGLIRGSDVTEPRRYQLYRWGLPYCFYAKTEEQLKRDAEAAMICSWWLLRLAGWSVKPEATTPERKVLERT